eukprot:COSAG02_NODE_38917_length_423_cov_0.879630_1_plen_48_part_01
MSRSLRKSDAARKRAAAKAQRWKAESDVAKPLFFKQKTAYEIMSGDWS